MSAYDSTKALSQYLFFHYPEPSELENYPRAPIEGLHFIKECVGFVRRDLVSPNAFAVDLGCAVGRASFELSCVAAKVIGVDLSEQFIAAANILKSDSALDYRLIVEGELTKPACAIVPSDALRDRVVFQVGDVLAIGNEFKNADIVLALNLLDRVRKPSAFLESMATVVKSGGQLILASPFSWLADFTPKENWLGGYSTGGEEIRARDVLGKLLPAFTFDREKNVPYLIREHARLYQWGVSYVSRWIRNK